MREAFSEKPTSNNSLWYKSRQYSLDGNYSNTNFEISMVTV
jgi:hypothetical protein